MAKTAQGAKNSFLFRHLPQNILIGTASDRHAGWIGQIYTEGRYEKGITRRSHKVKSQIFTEETLPVESVAEYFERFPLLEIDCTFYRPLLESKGSQSASCRTLKTYRRFMKDGGKANLKVPQAVVARKLLREGAFVENENYLNAAHKDRLIINLLANNRAGGNAPLIAEKIAARLHKQKQPGLF